VLDCWYEGCGSCFKEFPLFQKLYIDNNGYSDIRFYASGVTYNDTVNLFEVVERRNINLPMFTIERNDATELEITVYPTVIIIDDCSRIVFRGDLRDSELFLKNILRISFCQR